MNLKSAFFSIRNLFLVNKKLNEPDVNLPNDLIREASDPKESGRSALKYAKHGRLAIKSNLSSNSFSRHWSTIRTNIRVLSKWEIAGRWS